MLAEKQNRFRNEREKDEYVQQVQSLIEAKLICERLGIEQFADVEAQFDAFEATMIQIACGDHQTVEGCMEAARAGLRGFTPRKVRGKFVYERDEYEAQTGIKLVHDNG